MVSEAKQQYRDELVERFDDVRTDQEIRLLESQLGLASEVQRLYETGVGFAYSDPVNRSPVSGTDRCVGEGGRPEDYQHGRCWPLYETEQDLQELRAIGRWFASWDTTAVAILANLANYTIGEGSSVECKPRDKSAEAVSAAAEMQAFCDEFDDANDWKDEGETEAFVTSVRDGALLLRLKPRGRSAPKVQFIGDEHLAIPDRAFELEEHYGLPALDWEFGVATDPRDTTDAAGYFVDWYGDTSDWEFVPESEAVYLKRNTPRQAKRGVSDFGVVWRALERGAKLFDNTVRGGAIQASIAYIKEVAQGTPSDALTQRMTGARSPGVITRPDGGSSTATFERHEGGKVLTTNGKYHASPMGSPNGPVYLDIFQGVLRLVGSRWCMPEYMVSGDASNANYASTLAATSPFVLNTRQEQGGVARKGRELRWKAAAMAATHGRFGGRTVGEMRRLVEIDIQLPNPESRDPQKIESVLDSQQAAGVLSARTRAAKSNLDYDDEVANGAKKEAPATPFGPSPAPVSESENRERVLRFSLLEDARDA